jgi:hypothetical protein
MPEVCLHDETAKTNMENSQYRKRVSKPGPKPKKARINQDHHGLPQMMVAVSAEPEFGGNPISLTWAYKFLNGQGVSAPMQRVKKEALRRLRMKQTQECAA